MSHHAQRAGFEERTRTLAMTTAKIQQNNKYLVQTPGRLGSAQPMPQLIMPARNHLEKHSYSVAKFTFTIVDDHKCVFFMGRKNITFHLVLAQLKDLLSPPDVKIIEWQTGLL